jgi:outer membrane scaffolding protein for murein synthesis (MipA/OmpV family)
MTMARALAFGLALILPGAVAAAQDLADLRPQTDVEPAEALSFGTQGRSGRSVFFTFFAGGRAGPPFFGSDEMEFGPSFRGSFAYLNFGDVTFGEDAFDPDPYERRSGFGYGLAFRFVGERDSSEYDDIRGLDDIDGTLEIGLGFGYAWPNVEAIADVRYGLGGSDAWVGEARLFYVARPTDRLALRIGPRVLVGSDNYVDTYFGVSSAESFRSGLDAFDPDAGLVSAGVELIATYRLNERWWLEGAAKWEQFQGDAADSPIVGAGADDRTEVRIGVRRAFVWRF